MTTFTTTPPQHTRKHIATPYRRHFCFKLSNSTFSREFVEVTAEAVVHATAPGFDIATELLLVHFARRCKGWVQTNIAGFSLQFQL